MDGEMLFSVIFTREDKGAIPRSGVRLCQQIPHDISHWVLIPAFLGTHQDALAICRSSQLDLKCSSRCILRLLLSQSFCPIKGWNIGYLFTPLFRIRVRGE